MTLFSTILSTICNMHTVPYTEKLTVYRVEILLSLTCCVNVLLPARATLLMFHFLALCQLRAVSVHSGTRERARMSLSSLLPCAVFNIYLYRM